MAAAELRDDVWSVVGHREGRLITTNLDNDDGVAADFAARITTLAPRVGRDALYLSNGIIKAGQEIYLKCDPVNAFCSVVDDLSDPVTCWTEWHNRLGRMMPVERATGPPAWLQVVHGKNVSNRIRGRRVSPVVYAAIFPGAIDDVPDPSTMTLIADVALVGPFRAVRDELRSRFRQLAVSALGKERFDQFKLRLATRKQRGALGRRIDG